MYLVPSSNVSREGGLRWLGKSRLDDPYLSICPSEAFIDRFLRAYIRSDIRWPTPSPVCPPLLILNFFLILHKTHFLLVPRPCIGDGFRKFPELITYTRAVNMCLCLLIAVAAVLEILVAGLDFATCVLACYLL